MAAYLFWDSSAFAKRYAAEKGSSIAALLFDRVARHRNVVAGSVYAETVAALVRKKNARIILHPAFMTSLDSLDSEITDPIEPITLLGIELDAFLECARLIQRHNINGSDAAMLHVYLEYADAIRADGDPAFLVATDARLRRASESEGLSVLDPEELTAEQLASILPM